MAIKLYFKTLSSALLYEWEISGQISDGKYENAQPFGHWRWINDTEKIISKLISIFRKSLFGGSFQQTFSTTLYYTTFFAFYQ